jgi:formiminoglutamase
MKLPLLISVPHAGLAAPEEVSDLCILTPEQILADSDEGAGEIYALDSTVARYISTDIARAFVDVNRSTEDRGPDGVVKVTTCYGHDVYCQSLPEELVDTLLNRYYRPYHRRLTALAGNVRLGLDCHTMAPVGPPLSPDPGSVRPNVCLSNAEWTCPANLFESLATCFESAFGESVAVNTPFRGGNIIRSHAKELPWIQIELSQDPWISNSEKNRLVSEALDLFCTTVL